MTTIRKTSYVPVIYLGTGEEDFIEDGTRIFLENQHAFILKQMTNKLLSIRGTYPGEFVQMSGTKLDHNCIWPDRQFVSFDEWPDLYDRFTQGFIKTVIETDKDTYLGSYVLKADNSGLLVPDISGLFARTWREGEMLFDKGRQAGSYQDDAMRPITGSCRDNGNTTWSLGIPGDGPLTGAFKASANKPSQAYAGAATSGARTLEINSALLGPNYAGADTHPQSFAQPIAIYLGRNKSEVNNITPEDLKVIHLSRDEVMDMVEELRGLDQPTKDEVQNMINSSSFETPGKISWIAGKGLPGHITLSNDNGLQQRSAYPEFWALAEKYFDIRPEAEWQAAFAASKADGISGAVGFFSAGDGSATFRFPLIRNVYVRSEDVPSGVLAGMYQSDTVGPLEMALSLYNGGASPVYGMGSVLPKSGMVGFDASAYGNVYGNAPGGKPDLTLVRGVKHTSETRTKTIVLTPVMKVVDVVINPSLLLADEFVQGLLGKLDVAQYNADKAESVNVFAIASVDGTKTPLVYTGINVANIIRLETGIYTVVFTQPLTNINYVVSPVIESVDKIPVMGTGETIQIYNKTVNGFNILTAYGGSSVSGCKNVKFAFSCAGRL